MVFEKGRLVGRVAGTFDNAQQMAQNVEKVIFAGRQNRVITAIVAR
jgi:hypothetical protein